MSAQNGIVQLAPNIMVELTDANVTEATVLAWMGTNVLLVPSVDPAAPDKADGMPLRPGFGIDAGKPLSDWFPGVPGANRLHAYAEGVRGSVFRSHA